MITYHGVYQQWQAMGSQITRELLTTDIVFNRLTKQSRFNFIVIGEDLKVRWGCRWRAVLAELLALNSISYGLPLKSKEVLFKILKEEELLPVDRACSELIGAMEIVGMELSLMFPNIETLYDVIKQDLEVIRRSSVGTLVSSG